MEYRTECLATMARLLEPPDAGFDAELAVATDPGIMPPHVAGQIALFEERIAGLSPAERRELFAETFANPATREDCRRVAGWLRGGDHHVAHPVAESFQRLAAGLQRDRNPYLHLLTAARALVDCE